MAAYEAGLWMADQAGLAGKEKTAFALACLERCLHLQAAWYRPSGLLDEPWAEEILFKKRYGLPDTFTFADLEKDVAEADPYGPEQFRIVADRLSNRLGLAEAAAKAPARVGEAIAIPEGRELRFASTWIDRTQVQSIVAALGIAGQVEAHVPNYLQQNQPNNLVALVKGADGKTFRVGLGTDSQGVVRSAARLELPVTAFEDKAATEYFARIATSAGVPAADLGAAYERERAAGKSVGDAIGGALASLRGRMQLAFSMPPPSDLARLAEQGLISPAEHEKASHMVNRLFGSFTTQMAERTFFTALGALPGADRAALERLYLSHLRGAAGRNERADGLRAVFGAIPGPLPADAWPPGDSVLTIAGMGPDGRAALDRYLTTQLAHALAAAYADPRTKQTALAAGNAAVAAGGAGAASRAAIEAAAGPIPGGR